MRDSQSWALVILPAISGLWLAGGVGIIGALTPDYSHISQFMSALGAAGAPLAAWTNYAVFIPAEIWLLAFLVILNRRIGNSGTRRFSILLLFIYAFLLILAAFLPCDAGCHSLSGGNTMSHQAHMVIAAIAYPIALIGLLSLSLTAPRPSFLRRTAPLAAGVGFCLFLALIILVDAQGLFQRLLEAWLYLQFVMLGWHAASSRAGKPAGILPLT